MLRTKHFLMAAGLTAVTVGAATAETYRFAMWQPDSEATVKANKLFAEEVAEATDGEVSFEFFSGGVILPGKSMLQGIGDGIAQAGAVTSGYTPSDLPLTNSLAGFGFVQTNPIAIGAAYADWVMHDPAGLQEWLDKNIIPIGGFATANYVIICNTPEPITELSQFSGLKVRTYGFISQLVDDLGGVPVGIPSPESYQALQTGAIDCASVGPDFLTEINSLAEVSKSTTMTEWAPAFNSPQIALNRDFWQGLTEEQRAIMLEKAARAHARVQIEFIAAGDRSMAKAAEMGHVFAEPAESFRTAVADWVEAGVGDMAGVATNTYGVEDPQALFDSFAPYAEKWGALVDGMTDPMNVDALTQLIYDNMMADIDPATFGME